MTGRHDIANSYGVVPVFRHAPWMASAPCVGATDVFFPGSNGGTLDEARAICRGCEHRVRCLELALDSNEQHGLWGGLTVKERRAVKARRLAAGIARPAVIRHGTIGGYRQHHLQGVPPCGPCRDAYSTDCRIRVAERRESAA